MVTASYVMGLAQARQRADTWRGQTYQAAIDKALTWLKGATPVTNQDKAYLLLGLLAAGAGTNDLKVLETYNDLLDDQHSDGGWAERVGITSNAYATGQALYALRQAGLAFEAAEAVAGFDYLARNQADNGSWSEGTRYVNTDAGRPSVFLSTIWPVVALASSGERRFGVALAANPGGSEVEAGGIALYNITVRNTAEVSGASADTFNLTLNVPEGWTATLDRSSLTLDPGAADTVTLHVYAPANPAPGEVGVVTLMATSTNATADGASVYGLLQVPTSTPDRVGPDVTLGGTITYAGDDNAIFSGTVSETVTGNAQISTVEFQVDDTDAANWRTAEITDGTGTSSISFQFTASSLSAGSHTVYVRARDVLDNYTSEGNYATQTFNIVYQGPRVTLLSQEQITEDNTPRVMGTSSDIDRGNAAVDRVEYQVDSQTGNWQAATIALGSGTSEVKFWFDTLELSEGSHTLYVRAVDSRNNTTGESEIASVTLEVRSPGVQAPVNGFLRTWLMLGPVDNHQINQDSISYPAAATPSAGETSGSLAWEPASFRSGLIDVNDYYNPWVSDGPPDIKKVYAHLYINSAVEQTARLRLTSDDGIRIWLNGQQVFARDYARSLDINNLENSDPVTLQSGWNNLMVKVNEHTNPWGFALQLTDDGGAELQGLTYQLNRPDDLPVQGPTVTVNGINSPTEDATPTITGYAAGTVSPNVAYVEYQVEGLGSWLPVNNITPEATGVSYSFDSVPLDMGTRTIQVRAMDQWGNTGSNSLQFDVRFNTYSAAQKGLDWLMPQVRDWTDNKNCLGCHVQGVPLYGASVARARGYRVDATQLDHLAQFIHDAQKPEGFIDRYRQPNGYVEEAKLTNNAYALFGLTAYDSLVNSVYKDTLLAAVDWVLEQQQQDGRWNSDHYDPPVDQGAIMVTASMMTALKRAAEVTGNSSNASAYRTALGSAAVWLENASASTTQDKAYKLLGLMAAGKSLTDPILISARDALVSFRNTDGGWSERSGLGSNPYATGQAVYTLRMAGLSSSDLAVSKGLGYLVKFQNDNGSWNEGVWGVNTDASRPSSFTSTIWAVIALSDVAQYGVSVRPEADQPLTVNIAPGSSATYNLKVVNSSEDPFNQYNLADSYTVAATADLPGWQVQIDKENISLDEGLETSLVVTVTAPINSAGQTARITITATSQGAAGQGGNAVGSIVLKATTPGQAGTMALYVQTQRPGDAGSVSARVYTETGWIDGTHDGDGNFTWNQLVQGIYTVHVEATGYLAQDLVDLSVAGGEQTQYWSNLIYGDLDTDGNIGITDLQMVARVYGQDENHPNWHPSTDIVPDGRMDLFDLVAIVRSRFRR